MSHDGGWVVPVIDNLSFIADANHYRATRGPFRVDLIVIHNTETREGGNAPSGPWLSTTSPNGVSIHHLYGRDGTRYDIVKREDVAYHCGESSWGAWRGQYKGVAVLNYLSIGHELESTASLAGPGNGYTAAQIEALAYTVACELVSYGLAWDRVVTHRQIAVPLGRRYDPSAFDWDGFRVRTVAWVDFLRARPPADLAKWCV